jgi:hypothetical protein
LLLQVVIGEKVAIAKRAFRHSKCTNLLKCPP